MSFKLGSGVYVADVIMGGGKSTSAINMINSADDDERFIYLTPYTDEYNRIADGCKHRGVIVPDVKEGHGARIKHVQQLLKEGANISSSHALFDRYTVDMGEDIQKYNYTLFLDESYDVVRTAAKSKIADVQMMINRGDVIADEKTGELSFTDGFEPMKGTSLEETYQDIRTGRLIKCGEKLLFWKFPIHLLMSFKRIIILTYLFSSTCLKAYLEQHNVSFEYIGTKPLPAGGFRFCPVEEMPDYAAGLKDKVHILDNKKLNSIGDDWGALSVTRVRKDISENNAEMVKKLGRNIRNVHKNIYKCKNRDFIWSTCKDAIPYIGDKNIRARHVTWNQRAVNSYSSCHYMAYGLNIHNRPECASYFSTFGGTFSQDDYALGNMVQWIWRSAIRNGEEVWIYLPSKRMRTLLEGWLERVS